MGQYAVIGHPINHSLSPKIHQHNFVRNGDTNTYVALDVTPDALSTFKEKASTYPLVGFNVTIPHKETIIPFLDEISPEAQSIGAVNTVKVEDGAWQGYNTDVSGYKQSLIENFYITPNMKVLILGGGGAAKAVHYVHQSMGNEVTIAVRNLDKLKYFSKLPYKSMHFDDVQLTMYDIVVNATPIGLNGEDVFKALNIKPIIKEGAIGMDLIYNVPTPFLTYFENHLNGLGMLVHQAMDAYKIWTGQDGHPESVKQFIKQLI